MAGIALGAACDVYQHIGFLDSAEMTARYLLALADSSQYTRLQYKALTVLGSVEAERKHYGQAITYYDRAIPFAHKFGTKNSLINCFCAMGEIKYELKEYKSGLEYFQQAYNLGSEFNQPILNHFCAKAYGKTLHQAGYHKQAGEILSSYIEYQDSVLLKENKEVIAGLEARYQSAQKDIDLAKQEVVIESRTRQRNSYIFALIIAGLFAWFLYDRFRKNQRISAEKIENMEKVQKIMVLNSMLQGQEDERRRIARDLHDGLGTLLAATRMQIQNVERELKKLGEIDLADKAQKLIDNACKEVRRISHDMMPGALEEMGLIAAVEDLIDDVRAQREIIYNLQLPDLELRLDKQKAINIYRIIQEVLQNIIKHAQANIVEISISEVEDHIVIDISDDGLGFEPEAIAEGGIGLSNINSRIRYLGGTMKLDSQPGEGSHYAFIIPV